MRKSARINRATQTFVTALAAQLVLLLGACAAPEFSGPDTETDEDIHTPPGGPGRASAEELRAYLEATNPKPVGVVRFKEPLRWTYLNNYFVIIDTRTGPHLIELAWECKELRTGIYADMADRRSKRGILRAKIDTIRGCRIESFYKLPEPEAVEPKVAQDAEQ